MKKLNNSEQQKYVFSSQSEVWWRQALFLGITGLGLFLLLAPNAWRRSSTDKSDPGATQHALGSAKLSSNTQQTLSLNSSGSRFTSGRSLPDRVPADVWSVGKPAESSARPVEPEPHVWELDALVAKVKNMTVITEEGATDLKRMLQALRQQGAEAVPALSAFLRQGDDVNFAKMDGGELIGYQTLRQALIDTLLKIGGSEALAVSQEQLQQTRDPIEIAMLARHLETGAPGVHQEEVIQAVGNALQWAEQSLSKERPDVSPLFDLLRTYGGEKAVAVLKQFAPQWGEYALITLAGLSKGAGIPSLIDLAGTLDVAVENPTVPLQILAQAAARYPEAGSALVDLARAGQIPDRAWSKIGEALGGRQLQLSSKIYDGTPLAGNSTVGSNGGRPLWENYYIQWLNIRYEQRVVSADWSAQQINQAVALIDQLRSVASSPAAVNALQQAQAVLQRNG